MNEWMNELINRSIHQASKPKQRLCGRHAPAQVYRPFSIPIPTPTTPPTLYGTPVTILNFISSTRSPLAREVGWYQRAPNFILNFSDSMRTPHTQNPRLSLESGSLRQEILCWTEKKSLLSYVLFGFGGVLEQTATVPRIPFISLYSWCQFNDAMFGKM
jgi:hypothetical protein